MRITLFTLFSVTLCVPNAYSVASQLPMNRTLLQAKEVSKHDWSGLYTGWMLGAQFGRSSNTTAAFGYNSDNDKWDYDESGLNAGLELGYSYLWHQFILGPEIELGYLGMQGLGAQPPSPGFDTVGKSSGDFYTTFRARLGVDLNPYQLFATAGAIGVNYTKQVIDGCNLAPCGGTIVYGNKNDFVWGYTLGGGIERLFAKGLSAKLECLYFNLNNERFSGITNLGDTYEWKGQTLGYIIRGGLNYHF